MLYFFCFRNLSTQEIMREAAGMFATKQNGKKYSDAERSTHPLVIYCKSDFQTRRDIVSGHPDVESMLFVLDGCLCELSIPQIQTIFDVDGSHHRLAGATNYYVMEPNPASFDLNDALADTHVFATKNLAKGLAKGADLPATFFDDELENWPQDLKNLEKPVCATRLPLLLPKSKGYTVLHGNINSPDVAASLKDYHSIAFRWVTLMRDHKNVAMNDESKIPADCRFSFLDNRIKNNLNSIKIRYELEGAQDDSVRAKVMYAAQKLRDINERTR